MGQQGKQCQTILGAPKSLQMVIAAMKLKDAYSLEEGNGNPLQYSCLENPMDRGAWWATIHGVAKSRTRLSDFTSYYYIEQLTVFLT